ncbi:MAG: circularly permuted type 2 ATP-grasp protein, partial [Oleiharenicola lentus]
MSAPASSARSILHGYAPKGSRFDECVDAAGHLRPAWQQFFSLLNGPPAAALQAASEASHRAIIEQDVSMNVYRGERAGSQLWPMDVLPLLIGAGEWTTLARGLRQRAHLFNEMLLDLYGEQKLLRGGLMPAALAMHNPHFLRPCVGLGRGSPTFLHTLAVDVARSSDGRWWVIEDRLDAPSGLGYSLQNRIITRQALPDVFHRAPVQRLYQFFRDYRESLERLAPQRDDARIVLLSPGAANETYFEQAYLSNYLGYTLVEGEDLTTRNRKVFLRTVGGLQQVDVLLRRLDSDYCDPLELDPNSLLGVPGLLNAAHSGSVALANLPGCRALESPALLGFLQPL